MKHPLKIRRGSPLISVGDREMPALIYSTGILAGKQVELFRDLGVPVVSFPTTCDFHLYGLAVPCWTAAETYDYADLEARIETVLNANPAALILPRVYTCSPPWWDALHPEDLVVWEDGSTERPLMHGAVKEAVPSLASDAWLAASNRNLARFIEHLEHGPFADHVLGYMVNSGNSEEWFHWGIMEGYHFDYGPAMRRRFQDWLRERYRDVGGLSAAWGCDLTFEAVVVPDADRRRAADALILLDPVADRDVIDYGEFFAELTADVIASLAKTTREATAGRKLFGTFYGYLVELCHHPAGLQNGGHLGLRRVLRNPDVHFLASPTSYALREPGSGTSFSMIPGASLHRHHKILFHENDVRTHILPEDAGYGRTENRFETITIQRRELAFALTSGFGMWWFDMSSGWYDEPATSAAIAELAAIARRALDFKRQDVAEIALVLDDRSLHHVRGSPSHFLQLVSTQCLELSRTGAPFDVILLEDLLEHCPYRLLLFPTLFHAPRELRERLHAVLAAADATAVWIFAPGEAGAEDPRAASKVLTGIRTRSSSQPQRLVAEADFDGIRTTWGTSDWRCLPRVIDDPRAEILGAYSESGEPALAARAMEGWHSIFSGAPALSGRMLRRLAVRAGAHLYLDTDDAVFASSTFIALHARDSGTKHLRVPHCRILHDVINDVDLRVHDGAFTLDLAHAETALLFRGSGARWRG